MIFRSEANGNHYIYNGDRAINFTPNEANNVWGGDYRELSATFGNSRKKLFVKNGVRYIVVSRGTFVEN